MRLRQYTRQLDVIEKKINRIQERKRLDKEAPPPQKLTKVRARRILDKAMRDYQAGLMSAQDLRMLTMSVVDYLKIFSDEGAGDLKELAGRYEP